MYQHLKRGLLLTCLVVAGLGTLGGASWADPADTPRVLAMVDGVPVTDTDADALRAILQPPPSQENAQRLAVDAALAWWDMYGWLAGSSAQGRLDAWRTWLVAGEDLGEGSAVRAIADTARRAKIGQPGSPRANRALELTRRSGAAAAAVPLRWLRIAPEGGGDFREVSLPLRSVEPVLASAVGQMDEGQVSGPFVTPSGIYWLQRVERASAELKAVQ